MTHEWHDTYRHRHTPAHHLDPRSKLLVGLLFVFIVLFTPELTASRAAGFALFLAILAAGARLPAGPVLRRGLVILPFALLMLLSALFSRRSPAELADIAGRALLSIGAMAVVSMTTPFPEMLRALEQLRLPKNLVLYLAFLYRYGAVLRKETVQLERGWSARYFGRQALKQWPRLGHLLAALLLRSYERAERIYAAMVARGFSSQAPFSRVLHFSGLDAAFIGAALLALIWIGWGAA